MPRADRFTATGKTLEYFSDFATDFSTNPLTGNLTKLTNEDSIKMSLRNLVLTNLGSRFYEPLVGSKTKTLLFNPIDTVSEELLKSTIEHSIKQEPRARSTKVEVIGDVQNYRYTVRIFFECVNLPNQIFEVGLILKQIR